MLFDLSAHLKGWRTILANILLAVTVMPDVIANFAALFIPSAKEYGLMSYLPKDWLVGYVLFIVALNMFLRMATTTPVGKKL